MDKVKQVVAGVTLAAAAGGLGAQDFSKMEKPELVDRIVAKSLAVSCDPIPSAKAKEASYEARLRFAVASADTTDLRKLAKDNVAVCLNQKIDPTFFERSVHGAFFNLNNAAKVLMIADTPTGKPELMGAQTSEVISRFNKFDLANTAAPNSTTYGVMGGPMDRMTGPRDRNYIQWVPESGAGDQVKEKGLSKLPVFTPPAPGA